MEYARNVIGLNNAHSTEMRKDTPHPVVCLLEEQMKVTDMGGTMRLGAYKIEVLENTKIHDLYGNKNISERHRHRYEFNDYFKETLNSYGFITSGICPDNNLVEISEIKDHPFMIGSQFHPEFGSRLDKPLAFLL